MALTFSIPNQKKFFRYQPCLTINEIVHLVPELERWSVEGTKVEPSDEKLSDIPTLLLSDSNHWAHGCRLSYSEEDHSYQVKLSLPTSLYDWEVAKKLIIQLAKKLNATHIIFDQKVTATPADLENFPIDDAIRDSLKRIQDILRSDNTNSFYTVFGLIRPFHLDLKIIQDLLSQKNPTLSYSQAIEHVQRIDAFDAHQKIYEGKQGILGVYTLTQENPTILPYKPFVDFQYGDLVKNTDITKWELAIVAHHGDGSQQDMYFSLGRIPYEEFIEKLPQNKYHFIDAYHILVEPLSQPFLRSLVEPLE